MPVSPAFLAPLTGCGNAGVQAIVQPGPLPDGIANFIKLACPLIHHLDGWLADFGHRISSGPIEGINHKIKTLKRPADGYRDLRFCLLGIPFIDEFIYTITG